MEHMGQSYRQLELKFLNK